MIERRAYGRFEQEVPIEINNTISGKTKNLSLSGALCAVGEQVPTPSKLDILLELPSGAIAIKGRSARCERVSKHTFNVALYFDLEIMDIDTKKKLFHFAIGKTK